MKLHMGLDLGLMKKLISVLQLALVKDIMMARLVIH